MGATDNLNMKYRGTTPDGTVVTLRGTFAFGPFLTFYNEDAGCWLSSDEWNWEGYDD
jgi:hypothetical protein